MRARVLRFRHKSRADETINEWIISTQQRVIDKRDVLYEGEGGGGGWEKLTPRPPR